MAEKRQRKSQETESEKQALVARRDFTICHNEHLIQIKEGDDVSAVPAMFIENLKTEGVI